MKAGRSAVQYGTRSIGFTARRQRSALWRRDRPIRYARFSNRDGLRGLEGIFHEGMHQWDGQVYSLLSAQAKRLNATVPQDMPHALIWVTAGEAVRRLDPAYVPTVDALGIWKLNSSGAREPLVRLKAPLEEIWLPYLARSGTRDEAMSALLARIRARP